METLINHKIYSFYINNLQTGGWYYDQELDEDVYYEIWDDKRYTSAMQYLQTTGVGIANLFDCLKEMKFTIEASVVHHLKSTRLRFSEMLRYLLKNWIVRYISSIEMAFILVNSVYRLGLERKKCIPENIYKNLIGKERQDLVTCLKNIEALMDIVLHKSHGKSIRLVNNDIKHASAYSDARLEQISISEIFVDTAAGLQNIKKLPEVKDIFSTLSEHMKPLEKQLKILLDILEKEYESTFEKLRAG